MTNYRRTLRSWRPWARAQTWTWTWTVWWPRTWTLPWTRTWMWTWTWMWLWEQAQTSAQAWPQARQMSQEGEGLPRGKSQKHSAHSQQKDTAGFFSVTTLKTWLAKIKLNQLLNDRLIIYDWIDLLAFVYLGCSPPAAPAAVTRTRWRSQDGRRIKTSSPRKPSSSFTKNQLIMKSSL